MPQRAVAISLLALVGLLPWLVADVAPDWLAHDSTRVAMIGLALLAGLALLVAKPAGEPLGGNGWRFLVPMLLLAVVVRALLAPYPEQALREAATLLGMVALAAFLGRAASPTMLARAVVAATSAYAVSMLGIALVASTWAPGDMGLHEAQIEFFGYSNFRFYNHVQTVAMPLTLGVAALSTERRWRWLARIGAAAGFALLFQAWGRATGLALVVATVLVLVAGQLVGRSVALHARRWFVEALVAAAAGAVLLVLLTVLQSGWSVQITGSREGSNQERMDLVRFALARSLDSPLWGIGPMHLAGMRGMNAAHPHNAWAQVVAEWGWPVGLLLLGTVVLVASRLWRALRSASETEAAWGLVLLATGVAVLVDSLFSGNFVMPMSQLWIALLGGWMLAWWRHLPGRASVPAPWLGRPAVVILVTVQIWLAFSIAPEVRRWPQPLDEAIERYPNELLNPRFWTHGWFGEPGPRP
jgi:O-antigen ligase